MKRPRRMAPYILLAMLATLLAYAPHGSGLLWWQTLDNYALDKGFAFRGPRDVQTMRELPQTRGFLIVELSSQVPRPVLASLIHRMHLARVIALDLMLADREAEISEEERESPVWRKPIQQWRTEDALLAGAMKKAGNVVIGVWPERMDITELETIPLPVRTHSEGSESGAPPTFHLEDLPVIWRRPPRLIWDAARWHSHLRVEPDMKDGIVRRVRLEEKTSFSRAPIPSFSLAVARAHGSVARTKIEEQGESGALINYLGGFNVFPEDQRVKFKVALDATEEEDFRDLTVFVGQTNFSSKDIFPTPFNDVPGVHIQAQAAATWLTPGGGLTPAPAALTVAMSFLVSLLVLAPLARWPFWSAGVSAALLIVVTTVTVAGLCAWKGVIVPLGVPLIAIVLTYNGAGLVEIRRARATLGRFIGKDLVAQTLHPLSSLELGGRTEVATAFFCDLRGYSRLSETISPDRAANLLKAYTTTLTRVVESHGGRPIDYLGDGVFVLFEERHTKGMHALAAANAAVDAQKAFALLDESWETLIAPHGDHLEAAIAIHTGPMLIGLVGDEHHLKPGAVGDAVNVAAHAQSYSRECGHRILATREAVAALGDAARTRFSVIACGEFQFKGRQNKVELFGVQPHAAADQPAPPGAQHAGSTEADQDGASQPRRTDVFVDGGPVAGKLVQAGTGPSEGVVVGDGDFRA